MPHAFKFAGSGGGGGGGAAEELDEEDGLGFEDSEEGFFLALGLAAGEDCVGGAGSGVGDARHGASGASGLTSTSGPASRGISTTFAWASLQEAARACVSSNAKGFTSTTSSPSSEHGDTASQTKMESTCGVSSITVVSYAPMASELTKSSWSTLPRLSGQNTNVLSSIETHSLVTWMNSHGTLTN